MIGNKMGAIRVGDNSQGHNPYPPRPADQGSPNLRINGKASVRVGDHWISHCASSCHDGHGAEGSPNVRVNGKPKMRTGDAIDCGDHALNCSPNVKVNGK
jgi:uncharacterized Zn-binding protein involved in type VI secretion